MSGVLWWFKVILLPIHNKEWLVLNVTPAPSPHRPPARWDASWSFQITWIRLLNTKWIKFVEQNAPTFMGPTKRHYGRCHNTVLKCLPESFRCRYCDFSLKDLHSSSQEPAQFALSYTHKTESVSLDLCSSVGFYFYLDKHFILLLLSLVPSLS